MGLIQNTVRWRSHQFQPTHIWNPWSNETDANLEDSACIVRVCVWKIRNDSHISISKIFEK